MNSHYTDLEHGFKCDFTFTFNNSNFSDRVCRIEIISDSSHTDSVVEGSSSNVSQDSVRNRKRQREDNNNEYDTGVSTSSPMGAAKWFLAAHYRNITKFMDDVLKLPLAGIEAVLANDDLQIPIEDYVYDLIIKWANIHYPDLESRRAIISTRLCRLIRFPHMSCDKLRVMLIDINVDPKVSNQAVLDALFFKAEAKSHQRILDVDEANSPLNERLYMYRFVNAVEFELPHPHCIIYFDLKRTECQNLHPTGHVCSIPFRLGGQMFYLVARCNADLQIQSYCFTLMLTVTGKAAHVDFEVAARSMPTLEYASQQKENYVITPGMMTGCRNMFNTDWNSFVAQDSPYFINAILHLRAEVTLHNNEA